MVFLIEMLYLVVIVVHHKLFGDPTVTYVVTDNTVTLSYNVGDRNYTFVSTQYIYTVKHSGILKYNTKSFYYKVSLVSNSPSLEPDMVKNYALMCPYILKNTSYPHRLAINAHFKSVTQSN